MTQASQVLLALLEHGTSNYSDLVGLTAISLNSLRWTVNDMKSSGLVALCEDSSSNAVAWKLTPKGRLKADELKASSAVAERVEHIKKAGAAIKKAAAAKPKAKPKNKPAAKPAAKPQVGASATPAAGGGNNSGNSASVSPVGAATTPTEGAVVVETRAEVTSEAIAAAAPAVSDEIPRPKYNPDSVAFGRPCAEPDEMHLAIDHKGQLTIDSLRFSPEETRLIGQFLIDTEAAWS